MFAFTMGDSSHIQPLDVSGPGHVVAERWRKWRRSFLYHVEGKGPTERKKNPMQGVVVITRWRRSARHLGCSTTKFTREGGR